MDSEDRKNFFYYNNGITIVCSHMSSSRTTPSGLQFEVNNPQVVNGCQTVSTIYEALNATYNDGGTIYTPYSYFKTKSGNNICSTSSQTGRLILHGGYYNETSGTTQKTNITTYKSATTEVSTLSPAITVDGRTYHYQLLTDFNITWLGGDSYSKVTTLKSGTMPSSMLYGPTRTTRRRSTRHRSTSTTRSATCSTMTMASTSSRNVS